jgi:hypothetical protein
VNFFSPEQNGEPVAVERSRLANRCYTFQSFFPFMRRRDKAMMMERKGERDATLLIAHNPADGGGVAVARRAGREG